MKKLTFTIVVLSFFILAWQLQAQDFDNLPFKTELQKKKAGLYKASLDQAAIPLHKSSLEYGNPGNSADYWWSAEQWVHATNSEYSYNGNGQIIEEIAYDVFSGNGIFKVTIEFDEQQNMTQFLNYYWDNSSWIINYGSNTIYTYGSTGKTTEVTYQYYDNFTMEWINTSRIITNYDADWRMTEEISLYWSIDQWYEEYKDVFGYAKGDEWSSVTTYYAYDGDWYESSRVTDIVWHNWEMLQPVSAIGQAWDGNNWYDNERFTGTYTGQNYTMLYEMIYDDDWIPNERETFVKSSSEEVATWEYYNVDDWINTNRYSEFYDSHNVYVGSKDEYWEAKKMTGNSGWVIDWYNFTMNTYNEDGFLVEAITQYWDYNTSSLLNSSKKEYSNFGSADISESGSKIGVKVYPNPVEGLLEIKSLDGQQQAKLIYQVVDLTGKMMLNGSLVNGQKTLDLQALPSGLYLLNLSDGKNQHTLKVQKL